jgi:hypothetical protein
MAKCSHGHLPVVRQLWRPDEWRPKLRVHIAAPVRVDARRQRGLLRSKSLVSAVSTTADVCAANSALTGYCCNDCGTARPAREFQSAVLAPQSRHGVLLQPFGWKSAFQVVAGLVLSWLYSKPRFWPPFWPGLIR